MTQQELIAESNRQFIGAWSLMAEPVPGARVDENDGIAIADARVPLFIMNTGFLTRPLEDAADARRRAAALAAAFSGSEHGWMVPVCDAWAAGEAGEALAAAFTEAGLAPMMSLAGMSAAALAPPVRALSNHLEIRPAASPAEVLDLCDLNCAANQIPLEMGRASVTQEGFWSGPRAGYVGYVNGEAAAAGSLFVVDGVAYIGWMATAEAHRGKGYAELIMRHALEQERVRSGITRTVLHATEMGEPVYRRLGYETHTVFTCWLKTPAPDGATAS
ncbi:MAG: GNAT family N-acetyltransferase [Bryobacteraceae bacterium]|nr:GNAT family N-acetyltransferase [Bryobacteraceae bacterium]